MSGRIIIPAPRGMRVEQTEAGLSCVAAGLSAKTVHGADLPRMRDVACQEAVSEGADVVLLVDTDNGFKLSDAQAVVSEARRGRCAVGAAYQSSNPKLGHNVIPLGGLTSHATVLEHYHPGPAQDVDGLGTGFLAIHRDVFDAIERAFPELQIVGEPERRCAWFRKALFAVDGGSRELSQDLSFCWRAREAGCAVKLKSGLSVTHRGAETPPRLSLEYDGLGLGEVRRVA